MTDDLLIPAIYINNKDLNVFDVFILSYIKANIDEDYYFHQTDVEISRALNINQSAIPNTLEKFFKLGYIERSNEGNKRTIIYTYDAPHKFSRSGFVYIMKDETHPYLKIGFSNNPTVRESTLQGEKPTISLVAKYKGTMADEQTVHRILAKYRVRGEWFNCSLEQAQATIKQVIGV